MRRRIPLIPLCKGGLSAVPAHPLSGDFPAVLSGLKNAVIYKAQVKIKVGLSGIRVEIGIEIEPVQRRRAF